MSSVPLYLVDLMGQVYRAYHAVAPLRTAAGQPTHAVYGLAVMLQKLRREHPDAELVAAFDTAAPTRRHLDYPAYKATRPPMPDDLVAQLEPIRQLCAALNVEVLACDGYEADDLIATCVRMARAAGRPVVIVSRDKDLMQLVGPGVSLFDPQVDRTLDAAGVRERLGVEPGQVTDYLALIGDSSDNVPGAPGVGPKTATRLLAAYGSLAGLYAALEQVESPRIRETLAAHRDQVWRARALVTLDEGAPVSWRPDRPGPRQPDWAVLRDLYGRLEFRSLRRELPAEAEPGPAGAPPPIGDADGLVAWLTAHPGVAVALEPGGPEEWFVTPAGGGAVFRVEGTFLSRWPANHPLRAHRLKPIWRSGVAGWPESVRRDDVELMHYLLAPHVEDHGLDRVADDQGLDPPPAGPAALLSAGDHPAAVEARAAVVHRAADDYRHRLAEAGLLALYEQVELPLTPILARMEAAGVCLDVSYLNVLSTELGERLEELERKIHHLAGGAFNQNSPKQLAEVLFDRLGLAPSRKTPKTGSRSTGSGVLEQLADAHPLPALVLEYRQFAKLKSTYVDALPRLVSPVDGRVHTTFHQAVAATGRLSSANPNLQNIPIRTDWGQRIRRAFVVPPGWQLVSADYSQIELRIVAHLSGDARLTAAFAAGVDVHQRTALEVFGPLAEAQPAEYRRRAKAINYGILYGQGEFGLARELQIPRVEAQAIITAHAAAFPDVRAWVADNLARVRREGVARTLFGRLRPLPELASSNGAVRAAGERIATNMPVQGTAADVIKMAMIRLDAALARSGLAARPLLQVHDELVLECPAEEVDVLVPLLRQAMEGETGLSVPPRVDIHTGPDWLSAKG